MEVIPAVLTNDPFEVDKLLRMVRDSKKFERVQIDFIDGKFSNNTTIKPQESDLIPYFPIKFDAHLMVVEDNILQWSKIAEKMGFDRVIVQAESVSEPGDYNCLAMDFHSPVKVLEPYLPNLDLVLVMGVEPGFGGQEFVNACIEDVKELVRLRKENGFNYRICVDGGIEKIHLEYLEGIGVDEVAVGVKRVLEW